ncbi:MAG: hypothetical protein OXE52_20360 [Chloroflexi bacterium]|nr:hypothetical protein [Chloroflexota bacterium]
MKLPRNPKFRLFVRLITYIALKSFALGLVDSLLRQRSLDNSLNAAQAITLGGMLTFGIAVGVVGVVIAAAFGREPDPRHFKLAMALAVVAVPAIVFFTFVQQWLRYPNSYVSSIVLSLAHATVSVWISQIAARKYLAEQYASLQRGNT